MIYAIPQLTTSIELNNDKTYEQPVSFDSSAGLNPVISSPYKKIICRKDRK